MTEDKGAGGRAATQAGAEMGHSLAAATSQDEVDRLNSEFYGKIKYPWPPTAFERVIERGFWSRMLGQDIGSWDRPVVPEGGKVWVAGCGTNQALITALKFPEAEVLGSDLSEQSLDVCRRNAASLGVENLTLRRESLNEVSYEDRFDYVICTGVIHHNADPSVPLRALRRGMKPEGVLELMVYNQYHRLTTAGFQVAIRTLLGTGEKPDLERELPVARKLVETFNEPNMMSRFLKTRAADQDAAFCDALLQPVEHSYTVGSLDALAEAAALDMLTFAIDPFSKKAGAIDWNLTLRDPSLQALYTALPDTKRWQITNHMLLTDSPMLWFYLQRKDSPRARKSEAQLGEEFAQRRFKKTQTEVEVSLKGQTGTYQKIPEKRPFPGQPRDAAVAKLYAALDEKTTVGEALRKLGAAANFNLLHKARINLATSAFPFLAAI
ncbi:MAG: class I SAM-dependent methyltransferase [Byssovorax sp.]